MTYPIVTKENFEEICKKHVSRKSGVGFFLRGIPQPRNKQEFFEMTKNMFGVGLGVSGRTYHKSGNYEIEAVERLYSSLEIPRMWNKKYGQYDGLKVFLEFTFSSLTCGGVAARHYGQFNTKGHRHRLRLQNFWKSQSVPSESIATK